MKGREANRTAPSADLLVCFPSRAHLALMPKPICSPARPSEPRKRHSHHPQRRHHHLKKLSTRTGGCGAGQASPLLWAKNKQMSSEISEPTSPKVTCAGQIKVRSKTSSCKNWQSVMEEIERIHNSRQRKKRPTWIEAFGFKKEILQFLTCLRSIRFDLRCFGAFPHSEVIASTDDEDEDEEDGEYDQENHENHNDDETSRTVFSKWFMVLQENQSNKESQKKEKERSGFDDRDSAFEHETPAAPPPNALLLMRCRSAPAKSWLEEKEEDEEDDAEEEKEEEMKKGKDLKSLMEEETMRKKKESLVVMRYDTDFYKFSSDVVKETWVVGGMRDPLSRSRSWKR
ncbi:uncharacterized protein LOC110816804 [Carica papaya]|uniref:uncharacterized protein LOC110816804 n=1 Tax=Carica papaya TaxID=3649 RepID=UPI000B8D07B9|nr:uncharacterized protein LOC110816804 [Carica papaya]